MFLWCSCWIDYVLWIKEERHIMRTSNAVSTVNDIINDKLKYNFSIMSLKADVIGFECRCHTAWGWNCVHLLLSNFWKFGYYFIYILIETLINWLLHYFIYISIKNIKIFVSFSCSQSQQPFFYPVHVTDPQPWIQIGIIGTIQSTLFVSVLHNQYSTSVI